MSGAISYMNLNGLPVLQPDALSAEARRLNVSDGKWRYANSVTIPRGTKPGQAWVLVDAETFGELSVDQPQVLTLTVEARGTTQEDQTYNGLGTIIVPDMWIYRADAVLAGTSDVKGPYVLELRDPRQLFQMSRVDASYNVLRPDEAGYWASTTDSATPWSWPGMLNDLATRLPTSPNVTTNEAEFPAVDPENFRFEGTSAWQAIDRALADIGHIVCPKLQVTPAAIQWEWRIARPSYEDPDNFNIEGDLQDTTYSPTLTASRVPATFSVTFPDRDYMAHVDGDDKVLDPHDSVDSKPVHVETVSSGMGVAGTSIALHDSLPVRRDPVSGAMLNQSELQGRAGQIAALYASRLMGADRDDYYSGLHGFSPDGEVDAVTWFDFGDGWMTRVAHGPHYYYRETPWHKVPDVVEPHLPVHRKFFGRVTTGSISPSKTGSAVVQYIDGSGNWADSSKSETFRNVGLDPIVSGDRIYAEWWWQTKEWVALCGFRQA